jgi:hypothetical protein
MDFLYQFPPSPPGVDPETDDQYEHHRKEFVKFPVVMPVDP